MDLSKSLEYMSATKRNEWHKMIHDKATPSFDRESVIETVRGLLLSRGTFLGEKVDGIFRKLSGKHVTNSPQGFRERMIIEYIVDKHGSVCHERVEYLHDLRSVIAKLQGRDEPKTWNTLSDLGNIVRSKQLSVWHDFDGGAFRIKLYKVGTVHMEIHPEIAVKLNQILASMYPSAIADTAHRIIKKEKTIPLVQDILPYEVTQILGDIADSIGRGRKTFIAKKEIDKSTYVAVEDVLTFLGGISDNGMWTFPYDVSIVLIKIIRTGCLPEKVSHQFYPTEKELAERVVGLVNLNSTDTILEPSAGHGAIAEFLPKERTTCVEVNMINGLILKQKGFTVETADFLKWESSKRFSKVVMNPPFAKGEAERHVTQASKYMSKGGKLVAILPASLRNKPLVAGMTHVWSDVIKGAFADTGVSVVILELTNT